MIWDTSNLLIIEYFVKDHQLYCEHRGFEQRKINLERQVGSFLKLYNLKYFRSNSLTLYCPLWIYLNNKILSLLIHSGYECSDIAEKIHV